LSDEERTTFTGSEGAVSVRVWRCPDPARTVVLAHGYGEHIGRYEHVADALVRRGAAVYGPDHLGHGRSDGERVLITKFERLVDDVHRVVGLAREDHPALPIVLVGHSMGGLVAIRYAQRHR
jgi:alpha-beta hydrolase superfamily lysophospholipase